MPALPAQMTAIAIRAPGGPDMLVPEQRPLPHPAEGEVLVKVAAAGVNRPDVMQRQGLYPPPKGATDIPGLEIAGTVVALGSGVTRWKSGDQVTALLSLQSSRVDAFDDWHVQLLEDVAAHVSLALSTAAHFHVAQTERRRLEALHVLEMSATGAAACRTQCLRLGFG